MKEVGATFKAVRSDMEAREGEAVIAGTTKACQRPSGSRPDDVVDEHRPRAKHPYALLIKWTRDMPSLGADRPPNYFYAASFYLALGRLERARQLYAEVPYPTRETYLAWVADCLDDYEALRGHILAVPAGGSGLRQRLLRTVRAGLPLAPEEAAAAKARYGNNQFWGAFGRFRVRTRLAREYRKLGRIDEAVAIEDDVLHMLKYADADHPIVLQITATRNATRASTQ